MPRDRLEREITKRKPEAKTQKFPQIRKAFRQIVRSLAKEYRQPQWLVENTIRERGLQYTIETLKQTPPRKGVLAKLRSWFRK